jgi:ABC-type multidrug transport system fused ATPase/permease subunit
VLQDPVMFSGTIRTNLDPVGELRSSPGGGDTLLWDVLKKVREAGPGGGGG